MAQWVALRKGLKSKKSFKRVAALENAAHELLNTFCPDSILSLILEDGIGSETAVLRELSFSCIHSVYLYEGNTVRRWADVRTAILTEISSAEDPRGLAAALHILTLLRGFDLVSFFASKDVMSAMKDAIVAPEPLLRAAAVGSLGHVPHTNPNPNPNLNPHPNPNSN